MLCIIDCKTGVARWEIDEIKYLVLGPRPTRYCCDTSPQKQLNKTCLKTAWRIKLYLQNV